eukprot:4388392-Amphidinium_carterae.1
MLKKGRGCLPWVCVCSLYWAALCEGIPSRRQVMKMAVLAIIRTCRDSAKVPRWSLVAAASLDCETSSRMLRFQPQSIANSESQRC